MYSLVCVSHKLVLQQWGSDGQVIENIEITELSQMLDYSQPHAPGEQWYWNMLRIYAKEQCVNENKNDLHNKLYTLYLLSAKVKLFATSI